jgi:hypothetical protein
LPGRRSELSEEGILFRLAQASTLHRSEALSRRYPKGLRKPFKPGKGRHHHQMMTSGLPRPGRQKGHEGRQGLLPTLGSEIKVGKEETELALPWKGAW